MATNALVTALLSAVEEGGETTRELPMEPLAFGLIAFAMFMGLLAATWAFRSVANKH